MTDLEEVEHYGPVAGYMADVCVIASEPWGTPLYEAAHARLDNFWWRHMSANQCGEVAARCAALNRWEEEHGIE